MKAPRTVKSKARSKPRAPRKAETQRTHKLRAKAAGAAKRGKPQKAKSAARPTRSKVGARGTSADPGAQRAASPISAERLALDPRVAAAIALALEDEQRLSQQAAGATAPPPAWLGFARARGMRSR
jgi:hypothetical protein